MKRNFAWQFLTLSTCAAIAFTNSACDSPGSSGLFQGQGGQADGMGGQGGQGGAASSSSGGSSGGQGGAASSSSSGSSGQAGSGGQGGAASSSSSSSSSSGQAGAGGGGNCLDGQTQSCYSGPLGTENIGACIGGSRTCVGGMFEGCIGEITPSIELCDNVDNDCNGQVDEGNPGGGSTCNTGQSGVCGIGATACSGGSIVCNVTNQPQSEVCDGLDNNCNGQVDDGNPGSGFSCSTGQPGACAAGITACSAGAVACNAINQPKAEVCDGLDNNCNGQVDDGNPEGGLTCNTGQLGICGIGTTACSGGSVVCNVTNQPQVEVCDAFDNDCDGQINEGNPGGNLACNTGQFGECAAGKTLCAGNAISCVALKQPTAEICDTLDNDCDGQVDDGNPGGGALCQTGQPGICASGKMTCSGGAMICSPINPPQPEACDMLDNNCDGQVDEGNPGLGMPCNTGQIGACGVGSAECVGGTIVCHVVNQPSPEICDNIDNDCDGQVDEGNPGGGMDCGLSVGECGQKTVCNNGAIVCGGTFVGPIGVGAPNNPGSPAQPLSTIAAAQAKAQLLGGGNICLCGGIYKERVTMIEGISVYGGYDCMNWSRNIAANTTTIEDPIMYPNGPAITFPPGITAATTLDGVTVQDLGYWGSGAPWPASIAISIADSSPTLVDVFAHGDDVWDSRGMVVTGTTSNPTVLRGGYYSHGVYDTASRQTAVMLSGASGTFTDVSMQTIGYSANSTGLSCGSCGATIVGGNIYSAGSQTVSTGISVSGNAGGLSITGTSIAAGAGGFGTSYGAQFSNCNGSPSLTNVNLSSSGIDDMYGFYSTGAQCAPVISGSVVHAEGGPTSYIKGIVCTNDSMCVVKNSTITAAGNASHLVSVSCEAGGCNKLSGNTIFGTANSDPFLRVGLHVKDSSPIIDGNEIGSLACSNPMGSTIRAAAYFENSSSIITNNVFYDKPCSAPVDVLILDNSLGASPKLYNNTVLFTTCAGCSMKRGLFVKGSSGTGIVRNNIFANIGTDGFADGYAVYGAFPASFQFFENNLLWAPNGGTLYLDQGYWALSLAAINALSGSTGNVSADPMLDSTFHLLPNSPCRNAGTATSAPAFDFDGNTRPQEMVFDIGADEYVP